MDLIINQLIIHELEKETEQGEATLFLTDSVVPVDERRQQLLEKLNTIFLQKSDTLHGYLSAPEDALFPGYFQHLLEQDFEETAFIQFTRDTMQALQLSIQGVMGAKGGYLVFADYLHWDTHLLGIFLVRDTEGMVFRKREKDASFDLDTVNYLNTDRLAMACRIRVAGFEHAQSRYVELIKHAKSQQDISEYFINWIGLERPESSRELTTTFLEMVNELPLPVDEVSGAPLGEGEFREKVMNFAMRSPEKTINLKAFDEAFYGEERPAQAYLEANEIPLDQEFRFDRSAVKKFFHYRIAANGIALQFTHADLQAGRVVVEEGTIVIKSPELVAQLRKGEAD